MKKYLLILAALAPLVGIMLTMKTSAPDTGEAEASEASSGEPHLFWSETKIKEAGIEIKEAAALTLHPRLKKLGKVSLHPDKIVHVLSTVRARASQGYKNIGDPVKKGEPIARLLSPEMGEKKNQFLSAFRKDQNSQGMFQRSQELFAKQIISLDDYKTLEADALDAAAALELSKQELILNGLSLSDIQNIGKGAREELQELTLRSPIEGTILERHLTVGENIDTTEPLYVIADLSKLWVEIPLFASEFDEVRRGSQVVIQGQKTKLVSLSPQVGKESYFAKGIAEIENIDCRVLPGAIVEVEIDLEPIAAHVAIEREAVQTLEGKPHVFLETSKGFLPREVSLGAEDEGYVEIIAGLDVGDKYTAKHAFILKADLGKGDVEDDD